MDECSDEGCCVCHHVMDKAAAGQELPMVHLAFDQRVVMCPECYEKYKQDTLTNDDLVLSCRGCMVEYLTNVVLGQDMGGETTH